MYALLSMLLFHGFKKQINSFNQKKKKKREKKKRKEIKTNKQIDQQFDGVNQESMSSLIQY